MTKVVIILQARMAATRLPGKPVKQALGRPLLSYMLERLLRTKKTDEIIVATTVNPLDEQIVAVCEDAQIPVLRGSEEDVLDRFYQAAKACSADVIVRLTGDCPLIDPEVIDQVVTCYLETNVDYVSNTLERTYPRGMDVEVFSFEALEKAAREAKRDEEREHVTPYIYHHPELFQLQNVSLSEDQSKNRWTVDTQDDFVLVSMIINSLYPNKRDFTLQDILKLVEENPEWKKINTHVQQKPICDCPED